MITEGCLKVSSAIIGFIGHITGCIYRSVVVAIRICEDGDIIRNCKVRIGIIDNGEHLRLVLEVIAVVKNSEYDFNLALAIGNEKIVDRRDKEFLVVFESAVVREVRRALNRFTGNGKSKGHTTHRHRVVQVGNQRGCCSSRAIRTVVRLQSHIRKGCEIGLLVINNGKHLGLVPEVVAVVKDPENDLNLALTVIDRAGNDISDIQGLIVLKGAIVGIISRALNRFTGNGKGKGHTSHSNGVVQVRDQ